MVALYFIVFIISLFSTLISRTGQVPSSVDDIRGVEDGAVGLYILPFFISVNEDVESETKNAHVYFLA